MSFLSLSGIPNRNSDSQRDFFVRLISHRQSSKTAIDMRGVTMKSKTKGDMESNLIHLAINISIMTV